MNTFSARKANIRHSEDRLLLYLLFPENAKITFEDQAGEGPDWSRVLEKAEFESVAAAAYHSIQQNHLEDKVAPTALKAFRESYYSNLRRYLAFLPEWKRLFSRFRESGIPFLVIKGIALAEHVYPHVAVRSMSDIDILLRKEDVLAADSLLRSLGYSPADSEPEPALKNPVGYLSSLEYLRTDRGFLPLHIHWHLVNSSAPATAFAGKIDMARIWEKAVPASVAEEDSLILCPEHLIIYLCEHALRVGHAFDRLILVCDIYQSIRTYGHRLDWEGLVSEAKAFGLSRFVFLSLTVVNHYTGLEVPDSVLRALQPRHLSVYERIFLFLQLRNRRVRGSSFLLYLAESEGMGGKGRLIFHTLFPPTHILHQRRPDRKRKPTALLYLFRMKEVLGHLVSEIVSLTAKNH